MADDHTEIASVLASLTPEDLQNIVKQEAFNAMPPETAALLRETPELWQRVLSEMIADINDQLLRRKTKMTDSSVSHAEYTDYISWRTKAVSVKTKLENRAREVNEILRKKRLAESEFVVTNRYRVLLQGVIDHHIRVQEDYEPTPADTDLWALVGRLEAGEFDQSGD